MLVFFSNLKRVTYQLLVIFTLHGKIFCDIFSVKGITIEDITFKHVHCIHLSILGWKCNKTFIYECCHLSQLLFARKCICTNVSSTQMRKKVGRKKLLKYANTDNTIFKNRKLIQNLDNMGARDQYPNGSNFNVLNNKRYVETTLKPNFSML